MDVKRWLLRIAVVLSSLALAASGSWYVWREFYSAGQFRTAVAEGIETGDFSRAERLKKWGADTETWIQEDSKRQLLGAVTNKSNPRMCQLLKLGARLIPDQEIVERARMYARNYPNAVMVIKIRPEILLVAYFG